MPFSYFVLLKPLGEKGLWTVIFLPLQTSWARKKHMLYKGVGLFCSYIENVMRAKVLAHSPVSLWSTFCLIGSFLYLCSFYHASRVGALSGSRAWISIILPFYCFCCLLQHPLLHPQKIQKTTTLPSAKNKSDLIVKSESSVNKKNPIRIG